MRLKHYYFNARGLGDPIRYVLSYGGIDFEDVRVPLPRGCPAMRGYLPPEIKSKCRWLQVPLVEFEDGKTLVQSLAITRYFAKQFNLMPEDPFEAALCDEYVDTVRDLMNLVFPISLIEDSQEKKSKLEELTKTIKLKYFDVFDSIVKNNDGKHLVGSSLTWADIYLGYFFNHFKILVGVDFSEDYQSLTTLKNLVESEPNIKAYLEKRPETSF